MEKSKKNNAPPPVCIKFYIQPPLSLVVIFSYAPPLVSQPPLQIIIAQSQSCGINEDLAPEIGDDDVPEQIAHCNLSGHSRSNRIVKIPARLYDYP